MCGTAPTLMTGCTFYPQKSPGGLLGHGTCDRDGDGIADVHYDGNGTNDTTSNDLTRRPASCPTPGTWITLRAPQSSSGGTTTDTTPPGNVQNLQRTDKKP